MEQERCNLIYEYYKHQIYFGHFGYGKSLPSIEQICYRFQVVPHTVRHALEKLESKALIRIVSGKRATVVYQATGEEKLRYIKHYYVARKDALQNIYYVSRLLLRPLFQEGFRRLSDQAVQQLGLLAGREKTDMATISVICGEAVYSALDNRLANDLYREIIAFHQIPYLPSMRQEDMQYQDLCRQFIVYCQQLDRDGIYRVFFDIQKVYSRKIQEFIAQAETEYPAQEQIPFLWKTYRERPQHCHSLAARLICETIVGKYACEDFLPSYRVIAETYEVSFSTARRTVDLLRDMGVVNPLNGVGIQVVWFSPNWEKLRCRSVKQNIEMAIGSIQIFQATLEALNEQLFSHFDESQLHALKSSILTHENIGFLDPVFSCIEQLRRINTLPAVVGILGRLYECLLLTYPLLKSAAAASPSIDISSLSTDRLLSGLETKDFKLFSQGIQPFFSVALSSALAAAELLELGSPAPAT